MAQTVDQATGISYDADTQVVDPYTRTVHSFNEGFIYRNPTTNALAIYGDPTINRQDILNGGFQFVGGPRANPLAEYQSNQGNQGGQGGQNTPPPAPTFNNTTDPNASDYYQNDPTYKQFAGQFNDLKAQMDANSLARINAIHQTFAQFISQQRQINASSEAARSTSLLMGGSSRYAQISSEGIMQGQLSYGLSQISDLQQKENSAVADAQDAATKNDWDIVKKQMEFAESFRKEKVDAAQKLQDNLNEIKKKQDEDKRQATRDAAIASIISDSTNPTSDPTKILSRLKEKGYTDITMKDVGDSLDVISKNVGIDLSKATNAIEAFGVLSKKGGLPSDILALPTTAEQLIEFTKRYKAAEEQQSVGKWQKVGTDKYGDDVYGFVNEQTGKITYAGGGTAGGGTSGGGKVAGVTGTNEEYTKFLESKTPQQVAAFNGLSEQEKTNAMGLINGDILLSDIAKGGVKGTKAAQAYFAAAKRIDPNFSENVNKQRYAFKTKWNDSNGKAYQTRTGVNTALGHLSRLKELTDALVNNGDFQKANSVKNWIAANVNSDKLSNPDDPNSPTVAEVIGQFSDTVDLLSMEIARAYKGGVPDQMEVQRQTESINANKPKNVISAIINNKVNLMTGLLSSQGEEYKKVMGKYPEESIVNPDAISALKAAGVDTSKIEAKIAHQVNMNSADIKVAPLGDASMKIKNFRAQSPENDTLAKQIREMAPEATPDEIAKMLGL